MLFDARTIQTTEKLQTLRHEAETARHLRNNRTVRPTLKLRLGSWQLILAPVPGPA